MLTNQNSQKLFDTTPLIYSPGEKEEESGNLSALTEAYTKMFPSYTLPSSGFYQSFRHGATLFLITDARTFLDPAKGTYFGTVQKNWLISQIQTAATDATIKSIFITADAIWNYVKSAYDWDMIKQDYKSIMDGVQQDKKDVGYTLRNNINFDRPDQPNFKSVVMILGQPHLAFDDGNWNNYGNFPIAVCGPMDYWQQCRGGPYSHGSYHDVPNQFCSFSVYNDSNGNSCVLITGMVLAQKSTSVDQAAFMYDTCQPQKHPGIVNLKCPIDYKEKILNAGITIAAVLLVYFIFFVLIHRLSIKALRYSTIKED